MMQNEERKPWEPEMGFHHKLYLLNGKLLNYSIKVWISLMIGIAVMEEFHTTEGFDGLDMLKIKFIVFSMIGVAILGIYPWYLNPKDTWRLATSESGSYKGICNRCAAFLPFIGAIVLIFAGIFWAIYF